MAFLTINSVTYSVQTQGAAQAQSEVIGSRRRTWNGGFRANVIRTIRSWSFTLAPIADATFLTLQTSAAGSASLACTGDFNGGTSVNCLVDITGAQYFRPNPSGTLYRIVALTLTEV